MALASLLLEVVVQEKGLLVVSRLATAPDRLAHSLQQCNLLVQYNTYPEQIINS
jgi:hypothetical protein